MTENAASFRSDFFFHFVEQSETETEIEITLNFAYSLNGYETQAAISDNKFRCYRPQFNLLCVSMCLLI